MFQRYNWDLKQWILGNIDFFKRSNCSCNVNETLVLVPKADWYIYYDITSHTYGCRKDF